MPGNRAFNGHYGNGGLENPWSLILGLVALTPQAYSTWQRICFMSSGVGQSWAEEVGGTGKAAPLSSPKSELCPFPHCPEPQSHLAGKAVTWCWPTFLMTKKQAQEDTAA